MTFSEALEKFVEVRLPRNRKSAANNRKRSLIAGFFEAAFDRPDLRKRHITGFDQCIHAAQRQCGAGRSHALSQTFATHGMCAAMGEVVVPARIRDGFADGYCLRRRERERREHERRKDGSWARHSMT